MFKLYNLIRFDLPMHSWNPITIKIISISIIPKSFLVLFGISPSHLLNSPGKSWILLPVSINYFAFSRILYKWNHTDYSQYLASFTQCNYSKSHPCCQVCWQLNRTSERGYSWPVPDLLRKIRLNMRTPVGFTYIIFIRLRKFPSNSSFLREQMSDF